MTQELPALTMVCAMVSREATAEGAKDEWMSREELKELRQVLGLLGATAARLHERPRRKWLPPPVGK